MSLHGIQNFTPCFTDPSFKASIIGPRPQPTETEANIPAVEKLKKIILIGKPIS